MKKILELKSLLNQLNSKSEQSQEEIKSAILKFFKENPNPSDDQVHDFANQLGIEPDELESTIYSILSDLLKNTSEELEIIADPSKQEKNDNLDMLLPVGKHNHVPDGEFDPRELETGIQIEHEHTDDPNVAKAIAKDHLVELKNYYTLLVDMEKKAKENQK